MGGKGGPDLLAKAQLVQYVYNFMYFSSIHVFEINNNEFNIQIYTLFSYEIFFHFTVNGYESFNLIISPFNWSFFFTFQIYLFICLFIYLFAPFDFGATALPLFFLLI